MSKAEDRPVVNIAVPADQLDDLFKAVKKHPHNHEDVEFFVNQNPATQRMMKTVKEAYDAMSESLHRQILDILR